VPIIKEFKEFAVKGNAVDMAVGIIIGAAFGKIVSSMVNDVIMPPIGLLVGGIGIMNIMLVSVTERTREIGLRKAIGATKKDIMIQFLIEAILMSLIGGIAGIFFGGGASALIAFFAGWSVRVSWFSIILATSFSLFVGIIFGSWPAQKAAKLDPIEALRYE